EVDRFQYLENNLKVHEYDGKYIRYLLLNYILVLESLQEISKSIEFGNLGLRDNVAQVYKEFH
ncbi:hypothetical protein MKX01_011745, partial [Papaver californicum]